MKRSLSESAPPGRVVRRRWRIPPPLVRGSDLLEDAEMRSELAGVIGALLWRALQDVVTWVSVHPSERKGIFPPNAERERIAELMLAGVDPKLEEPLTTLAAMTGKPGRARNELVNLACLRITNWADRQGKLSTALAFAHAAALVCPGDASTAYAVGRIARRRAEYATAEASFKRAILLARQRENWAPYALAFSGLGALHMQRGNFPAARKFHTRVLRAARRYGLRDIEGGALHDMFTIAMLSGRDEEAEVFARDAYRIYRSGHRRLPHLAHDAAYFWMIRGHFARALPVFLAVLSCVEDPAERIAILANTARAAGATGEKEIFEQSWADVWEISTRRGNAEAHAEALLELARGASCLGDWDRAEYATDCALEIARTRGEARIQLEAESVLQSIQHDRRAEIQVESEVVPILNEEADRLAEEFVQSLNEYALAS